MRLLLQQRPLAGERPDYVQLILQQDLLGGWTLLRETGQIGGSAHAAQARTVPRPATQAIDAFEKARDAQLKRGFQVMFAQGASCAAMTGTARTRSHRIDRGYLEERPLPARAAPRTRGRTPVWLMRQAGRYLPEYRATRARAGSFLALATNPELACEVTLQPLARFDLDAAILFSDILTVPDAMGLGLYFVDGEGPKFHRPVRNAADIAKLARAGHGNRAALRDGRGATDPPRARTAACR